MRASHAGGPNAGMRAAATAAAAPNVVMAAAPGSSRLSRQCQLPSPKQPLPSSVTLRRRRPALPPWLHSPLPSMPPCTRTHAGTRAHKHCKGVVSSQSAAGHRHTRSRGSRATPAFASLHARTTAAAATHHGVPRIVQQRRARGFQHVGNAGRHVLPGSSGRRSAHESCAPCARGRRQHTRAGPRTPSMADTLWRRSTARGTDSPHLHKVVVDAPRALNVHAARLVGAPVAAQVRDPHVPASGSQVVSQGGLQARSTARHARGRRGRMRARERGTRVTVGEASTAAAARCN